MLANKQTIIGLMIYDISHVIRPGMAVWPGDVPYTRVSGLSLAQGDNVNSSAISLSVHAGTHLDAPAHYLAEGRTVDQLDLSILIGEAMLVSPSLSVARIQARDLAPVLGASPERLLIRARQHDAPVGFSPDYVSIAEDAARAIVEAGVRLVGTDSPSVDAFEDEHLPVHSILGRRDIVILENLRLWSIPVGTYTLVALPLKLEGGDGSPVRAVLLDNN